MSNVVSVDSLLQRRRGGNYLANMFMSMQSVSKPKEVITWLLRTNLANSDPSAQRERFLVLLEEDKTSFRLQQYSGPLVPGISRDVVLYKDSKVNLDFPSFEVKRLGTVAEFLSNNASLAEEIAAVDDSCPDQLQLCRAILHMKQARCTAEEALDEAERINDRIISIQSDMTQAADRVALVDGSSS